MDPDKNNPGYTVLGHEYVDLKGSSVVSGMGADHDGKTYQGQRIISETVDLAALSKKTLEEFGENAVSDFLTETLRNVAADAVRQSGVPLNADGSIDLVKMAGKSHLISRTRSIRHASYSSQSDDPVYEVKVDVGELREEFLAKVYELDPNMEMPNWLFDQLMLNAAGLDHQLTLSGMQAYFPDPIPGETVDRLAEHTWTELSSHISRVESIAGKEIPNLALAPGKKSVIQGDLITSYYQQEDPRTPMNPTALAPEDPDEELEDLADEVREELVDGAMERMKNATYEEVVAASESPFPSPLMSVYKEDPKVFQQINVAHAMAILQKDDIPPVVAERLLEMGDKLVAAAADCGDPHLAHVVSEWDRKGRQTGRVESMSITRGTGTPTMGQQGAPMTDQEREDAGKFTDYVGELSKLSLADTKPLRRIHLPRLSEVDPKQITDLAEGYVKIVEGVARGDDAETILGSIKQKF